jgi:PhzF family phenazine biosynthesis protein
MRRAFRIVDVFAPTAFTGNPVAVILDASGLDGLAMGRVAAWTNLSETTFVLPPRDTQADYRVRIFTTEEELPFAGHPTLGTAHAWLVAGGVPRRAGEVVQECGAGLVRVRCDTGVGEEGLLAFAAPPLLRDGELGPALLDDLVDQLGADPGVVVAGRWVDNGPGWAAVLLASAEAVLALRPRSVRQPIGVIGPHDAGSVESWEVRAFLPRPGGMMEDPVTGSLNASLAQWLLASGRATAPYTVRQGTALGRHGRVHVDLDGADIWIGGPTTTLVEGDIDIDS